MANWMGGSAPAMANQIAEGFILLSTANLKGFLTGDLNLLRQELEKLLRAARSEVPLSDRCACRPVLTLPPSALLVLVAYVAGITALGTWLGRRRRTIQGYFLAG